MPWNRKCPCRIGLDWISGIVEIISLTFFLIGFGTNYWAVSDDGNTNSGLFTTCTTESYTLCYSTHNYYHSSSAKGRVMGAAVLEMLTTCGLILVLLFMLLYMCGLFEEKYIGRLAAIAAYFTSLLGFIGIITFGAGIQSINFSIGWSAGLAIMGLLLNILAGIFIHVGSHQFVDEKVFRKSGPPKIKSEVPPLPPIRQDRKAMSRFPKLKLSA